MHSTQITRLFIPFLLGSQYLSGHTVVVTAKQERDFFLDLDFGTFQHNT